MNGWIVSVPRWTLLRAATLGFWVLAGPVAGAQTIPACAAGNNQATCTLGNVIFSNPTGVVAGGYWRTGAGIISDPFNPGFSTGNIVEGTTPGQLSRSGSFTISTLSGLPAIAGVSASITCGVTGGAWPGLSVTMDNGAHLALNCAQFITQTGTSTVTASTPPFTPVSSLNVTLTASGAIPSGGGSVTWTDISGQLSLHPVYYLPHLAFGGPWQTTLTYVNYSPQSVTCQTAFLSNSGNPLTVPFPDGAASSRTDNLQPGATLHLETEAAATDPVSEGWARTQCTGPIKGSLLYRLYAGAAAQSEAGVNAMAAPAREFATFGEIQTGVAFANPSPWPAAITITALDATTGLSRGSSTLPLASNAHTSANIGPLLHLPSTFRGSIQITSTVPIIGLSLNAEKFPPAFSALPPGDLGDGTSLSTGP